MLKNPNSKVITLFKIAVVAMTYDRCTMGVMTEIQTPYLTSLGVFRQH